ncbi:MAG TPA: YtxH domain-containing protein [Aggregatilineales bacterium]|nr:YtxH domain-containing protein [Aggregatilineales bacterium]
MRKIMFFVIGALLGVLLGATIALLLTPKSGDAMRDDARRRFDGMLDDARQAADAKQHQLETELAQMTTPPRA